MKICNIYFPWCTKHLILGTLQLQCQRRETTLLGQASVASLCFPFPPGNPGSVVPLMWPCGWRRPSWCLFCPIVLYLAHNQTQLPVTTHWMENWKNSHTARLWKQRMDNIQFTRFWWKTDGQNRWKRQTIVIFIYLEVFQTCLSDWECAQYTFKPLFYLSLVAT